MPEQSLSPAVLTQENDQSATPVATGPIGAAFVGPTLKGPAFVPTQVTSFTDFTTKFGQQTSTTYIPYAIQSYLQNSSVATVVRVLGDGGWSFNGSGTSLAAIVSGSTIIAVFHPSQNSIGQTAELSQTSLTGSFQSFVLSLSGSGVAMSATGSLNPTSANFITKVFGTNQFVQTGSGFPYLFFNKYFSASIAAGSSSYGQAATVNISSQNCTFTSSNAGGYQEAITPWIVSQAGLRLFRLHHISPGFASNTDVKIQIGDINPSTVNGVYSTFSVYVRQFNDTDNVPFIEESFANIDLNVNDTSFIGQQIGDEYSVYDSTQGKVIDHGIYPNNSDYIYVELSAAVKNGALDSSVYPAGFEALYETVAGFAGLSLPAATMVQSNTGSNVVSGFDFTNSDNLNYLNPVPREAVQNNNVAFYVNASDNKFIVPFQGGTDGMSYAIIKNTGGNITANNLFGFDLSTSTSPGTLSYIQALNILSNTDAYQMNLLLMPGVINTLHPYVVSYGISMVQTRTDCFYPLDICGPNDTISTAVASAASLNSSYAGCYYPWVRIVDTSTNKKVAVPPSVVVPQVYSYTDQVSWAWFAPAGLTRGGLGSVVGVLNKLTKPERDTLYKGRINPIASFPDTGITVWGQKTLQIANTALTRISVRRLLINLKDFCVGVGKNYVFEGNTVQTRTAFANKVNPYFSFVQANQGVYAIKFVMDETNNTADVIDQNQMVGAIYVKPTKTAEVIVLTFNVDATGASF